MNHLIFSILAACSIATCALADEATAQYRLTGLFEPDRVADLRRQAGALSAGDKDSPAEVRFVDVNYDTSVVTFAYDAAAKPFKGADAKKVRDLISNLLRAATRGTFDVFPVSALKPGEQQELRIPVAGLDCKGCAYGAYRVVAAIEGVERATVSFKEGWLTAWIDPAKTNQDAVMAALEKARVDLIKPGAAGVEKQPNK
jgi:copper chaperone CopZ